VPAGKVVTLRVTPSQSALLCFSVDGIVGQSKVELGQSVTRFDFASFYASLGSTVAGDPARLVYDSQAISTDTAVLASTLMALRAEPRKAVLDKAIGTRENAFYQKYANPTALIALQRQYFDPSNPGSKPDRLAALSALAENQATALAAAYTADGRLGVVKSTTSELTSTTQSNGQATTNAVTDGLTASTGQNLQDSTNTGPTRSVVSQSDSAGRDSSGTLTPSGTHTTSSSEDVTVTPALTTYLSGSAEDYGVTSGVTSSSGEVELQQEIVSTDYGYRIPSLESAAQNHRSQISLMDEQFAQFMFDQNLPYLETIFANELQGIDLDVKRLQVAYLDTILMSPIDGIVTGSFKQPGDGVKTGEAAARVETNAPVLLAGTLICRGKVSLGATVTITASLFSEPPGTAATVITGTIVAARGYATEDDWWDVVISYDNVDSNGIPILPLHYHFDFETTSIVIS
jgi:hypothetical protein